MEREGPYKKPRTGESTFQESGSNTSRTSPKAPASNAISSDELEAFRNFDSKTNLDPTPEEQEQRRRDIADYEKAPKASAELNLGESGPGESEKSKDGSGTPEPSSKRLKLSRSEPN